jgi:hypothetical protein
VAKDAVVANVAGVNHCQHFGPRSGMQAFVCFDLVRLQAYDLSNPMHSYLSPLLTSPLLETPPQ